MQPQTQEPQNAWQRATNDPRRSSLTHTALQTVSAMPAEGEVLIPSTASEAQQALASSGSVAVNFCASWCEPCEQMNTVFAELAKEYPVLHFVQLDADAFPDLTERFQLETVPAFLFLHAGALTDTLLGADVPELVGKVKTHALTASIHSDEPPVSGGATATGAPAEVPLDDRLRALTHRAPVMLFMKGSPDAPRCGFSRQVVELLRAEKVQFDSFDILTDEAVRQGLKTFSNWPTYPQLYGDGKLLGGLDVLKEMQEEGELRDSLPAAAFSQ